jgi:hypothetical protein
MCNPAVFTIASTMLTAIQQSQNASAMDRWRKDSFEANKQAATESAAQDYNALLVRQTQEHEKAAQSINDASRALRVRQATAQTSAGEAGVGGASVAQTVNEFQQSALNHATAVIRNTAMLDDQLARERSGVWSQERGRILSGLSGPVEQPNILGTILGGFGKALGVAHDWNALNPEDMNLGATGLGGQDLSPKIDLTNVF